MPYIHAAIITGLSVERKRALIRAMTAATVRSLEVPAADVHIFLWELSAQNMGFAGEQSGFGKINNVTVVFRRGRAPEVRQRLIEQLTDAVEAELRVSRSDVHVILSEVPPEDIGEGGILMGPPTQPRWYLAGPDRLP
jgi:4-oxalocrotonate tautomerase family enzyme